jgi:hypothetical protein
LTHLNGGDHVGTVLIATTGELTAGIIGGFLGGALGAVSTLVSSYYAPRRIVDGC